MFTLSTPLPPSALLIPLDFESKGLEDVEILEAPGWCIPNAQPPPSDHVKNRESGAAPTADDLEEAWVMGTATLKEQKPGWPIGRAFEDDPGTWMVPTKVKLPMKVRFRVALMSSAPAVEYCRRARRLLQTLSASNFPSSQTFHLLAFWKSDDEGYWSILEEHGEQRLAEWGRGMTDTFSGGFWDSRISRQIARVEGRGRRGSAEAPSPPGMEALDSSSSVNSPIPGGRRRSSTQSADPATLDLYRGYVEAVQVLLKIAMVIQGLHERRLAMVVCRPQCFGTRPRMDHALGEPNFDVVLFNMAFILPMEGQRTSETLTAVSQGLINAVKSANGVDAAVNSISPSTGHTSPDPMDPLASAFSEATIRNHLRYLAPELLSGNVAPGPVADIYSWATMAYELLSNIQTETSDDVRGDSMLTALHRHATKQAEPISKHLLSCPPELSDVIAKGLSLNPEDRYTDVAGLIYDLRKVEQICKGQLTGAAREAFVTGQIDLLGRFQLPSRIVQRDLELSRIEDAYAKVQNTGHSSVVCVYGQSGMGKSVLASTFARRMESAGYLVGWSKADQHLVKPMSSFIQLFESLLERVYTDPMEDTDTWMEKLRGSVSGNSQLIFSLLSQRWRELILGKERSKRSTKQDADWGTFSSTFRLAALALLSLFGSNGRPLILIKDDIQWETKEEHDLWVDLLEGAKPLGNCFVVCTFRTTTDAAPALGSTRATLVRATPLSSQTISRVLALSFHLQPIEVGLPPWSVLCSFIVTTTTGNAFYLSSLLNTLVRDKVVSFDYEQAKWKLALDLLPSYAEQGVDEFTGQILSTVSEPTKAILRILACLPSRGVSLMLLSRVAQVPVHETRLKLDEATMLGIVKISEDVSSPVVVFSHDRNHSAALRLIQESDIPVFYYRIANHLAQETEDYLFLRADMSLVVHHSGHASAMSRLDLCELVLSAASKGVRSMAFVLASEYLEKARELVDIATSSVWLERPALAMEFLRVETEVAACLRRPADVIGKLDTALAIVKPTQARIEIRTLRFRMLTALGDYSAAVAEVFAGFTEVGIDASKEMEDRATVPATPQDLIQLVALGRARPFPTSDADKEVEQLAILVSFCGPTCYVMLPDHGFSIFRAIEVLIFRQPAVFATAASGYPLAIQALRRVDGMEFDIARAYLTAAQQCDTSGTPFNITANFIQTAVKYLEAKSLLEIDYSTTVKLATQLSQDAYLVYIHILESSTGRLAGASFAKLFEDAKRVWEQLKDRMSPVDKFIIGSSLQLYENITAPRRSAKDLWKLEGTYVAAGDRELYIPQCTGFYAAAHYISACVLALQMGAPSNEVEKLVAQLQHYEEGGIGTIVTHEQCMMLAAYQTSRDNSDEPILYRGGDAYPTFLALLDGFPSNVDYRVHRSMLVAMKRLQGVRKGTAVWSEVVPVVDDALEIASSAGNRVAIGFLCRAAAFSFLGQSKRLARGYASEAYEEFRRADAVMVAQHIADLFPGAVTKQRVGAGHLHHSDSADHSSPSDPTTLSHSTPPSAELDPGSAEEKPAMSKEIPTWEKVNLESILRTFLILASERNPATLISKSCDLMMMINRSDFACLALQNPATQELCLRGVGFHDDFATHDLPLPSATALCPTSIMLHAMHLKKPTKLSSTSRLFEREPFYTGKPPPKSVSLIPLTIQGRTIGALMLSSQVLAHSAAGNSQISLLATFVAILLESNSTLTVLEKAVEQRTRQYTIAHAHQAMFLSNISHELRTPLNSIIGLGVLLQNSPGLSAAQIENVGLISDAAGDLLQVISQILDWSKIDNQSLEVEALPFSLRDTVESAMDSMAHLAHAKSLELVLTTTVKDDPPVVLGDSHRVRQVLLNLLSNAIKFTSTGGIWVTYHAAPTEGDMIMIRVDVKDTGLGIPADKQGRLFESFSQIDSSISRKFGGAGLGLAIVRGLSKLMGGDCWLEQSEDDLGSTFSFTIEVKREGSASLVTTAPLAGLSRKALVLSRAHVEPIAGNLRDFGVDARTCSEVDELWDAPPDANYIFVDVNSFDDPRFTMAELRKRQPTAKVYHLVSLFKMTSSIERLGLSPPDVITLPAKAASLLHAVRAPEVGTSDVVKQTFKKSSSKIVKDMGKRCPMRILFVDDSLVNLGVGAKILNKFGYQIVGTATNGLLAVDAVRTQSAAGEPYDLILMDLQMPVMDGYTATTQILSLPIPTKPTIVALTANVDDSTKERCLQGGFEWYMSKPLMVGELAQVLVKVYESRYGGEAGLGSVNGNGNGNANGNGAGSGGEKSGSGSSG